MKFLFHLLVAWCVLVSSSAPVFALGRCVRNRAVFGCVPTSRFVAVNRAAAIVKETVVVQEVVAGPVRHRPDRPRAVCTD